MIKEVWNEFFETIAFEARKERKKGQPKININETILNANKEENRYIYQKYLENNKILKDFVNYCLPESIEVQALIDCGLL